MLPRVKKNALPYLPILLLPVILFSVPLFGGKALYWGTPGLQFIPWRMYAWENLREGILPLWNPLNGMGAPLAANYQLGLYYPPGWLLYLFAALGGAPWMAWAHTLLVALHLSFAGWGMARLAKSFGLGELAQTVSALSFSLGGYLVARAGFFSMIWTAAWLPWALLAAGRIAAPGKPPPERPARFLPVLPVFLAFMLLAGHAQLSWYILLLAAAWVFSGGWGQGGIRRAAGACAQFGVALAAAVLLAAVQLLPTAEYLLFSQRSSAVDLETLMSYSFWPWRFLTLLAPGFFGNPGHGDYWGYANYWEDAIYIGLLPLLLAFSTLPFIGKKPVGAGRQVNLKTLLRFLWVLSAVSFLLALGRNTPVFLFLYRYAPTFDMFNAPSRYLIWAGFCLPLLAGIGAEAWRTPHGKGLYWLRLATAGGFAVTLGAFLGWFFLGGVSPTFVRATALAGFWGLGAGLLTLFMPTSVSPRYGLWRWLAAAWVSADLLLAGWALNPSVPKSFYAEAPAALASRLDGHRLYLGLRDDYDLKYRRFLRFSDFRPIEEHGNVRAIVLPNLNLLDGTASANNFDPLMPGRYADWMKSVDGLSRSEQEIAFALMDVGLVEELDVYEPLGVRLVATTGAARFRWYACREAAAGPGEALEKTLALLKAGRLPDRVVVEMEGQQAADLPGECAVQSAGSSSLVVYENLPGRIGLSVQADAPGWLFVADSYYPGWEASIVGEPTGEAQRLPIYAANYAFKAIPIPQGKFLLELRYRPKVFALGGMISLFTWLFGLISIIMMRQSGKGFTQPLSSKP